jgi:hypothetical protein
MRSTSRLLAAAALMLATATVACKGEDRAEYDSARVAGGTVDSGLASNLRVADVELGKGKDTDGSVRDVTDDFGANDTIYVAVRTTGTSSDARLTARWTFQDNQVVSEDSRTIAPTADAWTEFHVSKAGGWPKGNYKVAILLNGQEVESEDFEVK